MCRTSFSEPAFLCTVVVMRHYPSTHSSSQPCPWARTRGNQSQGRPALYPYTPCCPIPVAPTTPVLTSS